MVLDPNQEEEMARRKLHQMMDVVCVSSSAELKRRWRMELEGPLTVELYNEMMEAAMVDIRKKTRYGRALKEGIKFLAWQQHFASFAFNAIRTHAQCRYLLEMLWWLAHHIQRESRVYCRSGKRLKGSRILDCRKDFTWVAKWWAKQSANTCFAGEKIKKSRFQIGCSVGESLKQGVSLGLILGSYLFEYRSVTSCFVT